MNDKSLLLKILGGVFLIMNMILVGMRIQELREKKQQKKCKCKEG